MRENTLGPINVYVDGASLEDITRLGQDPGIIGITTNPTLMMKAGVTDYAEFAQKAIAASQGKPISFEVIADDVDEIRNQARTIAKWGTNAWVKVPVINTMGVSMVPVIVELLQEGIAINATAVLTKDQIEALLWQSPEAGRLIISIFCGRIADTGRDPTATIHYATLIRTKARSSAKLLWASVREPFNIVQAARCGADIITVPPAILDKFQAMWQRDLAQLSKDTVRMFYDDAVASGLMV